ncbi:MAG: tetraacyldisaccharide 4'-kinase, partial [Planctomycetota bacterium]
LRGRGVRVAILSRGYRAEEGAKNDEALELEQALPDVPHLQGRDRHASAAIATEELATQAVVLDDGFQHRRLARDLDIVLLDATAPYGYGHLLPRGTLREPLTGLRRAGVVCLTRADAIDATRRQAIRERVTRIAPDAVWCEARHRPAALLAASGETQPVDGLSGRRVMAFCGIGNPAAFRRTLTGLGAEVAGFHAFADHHAYTAADIAELNRSAAGCGAELAVCTHKDLVKVQSEALGGVALRALAVEMHVSVGRAELEEKLAAIADRALLET